MSVDDRGDSKHDESDQTIFNSVDTDISVSEYQTKQHIFNNLEGQISIVEKTSKKLLPIFQEVLERI